MRNFASSRNAAAVMRTLESDLRRHVRGEVRFDQGSKALYAADASNYRHIPLAVVYPRDVDDVEVTIAACRELDLALLARGAVLGCAGLDSYLYLEHCIENLVAGPRR